MPSGKMGRPHISDNKNSTVTVKYAPMEKGLHEMDIKYDGNHIPGGRREFEAPYNLGATHRQHSGVYC